MMGKHPQLGAGIRRVEYHVRGASTGIKQVRSPVSSSAQAGVFGMYSCFC